jgi:hypothetical protein
MNDKWRNKFSEFQEKSQNRKETCPTHVILVKNADVSRILFVSPFSKFCMRIKVNR